MDDAEKKIKQQIAERKKLMLAYHNVFNSEDGMIVLLDIVRKLGVWDTSAPGTPEAMALRNHGMYVLGQCCLTVPAVLDNSIMSMFTMGKTIQSDDLDKHIRYQIEQGG